MNEPGWWGSAGRAGERRLGTRRELWWRRWWREERRCPCFPVVLDPVGDRGVVVPVLPPEPVVDPPLVVVSRPPPLPLMLEAQLDVVMVLVSRVTAPVCASSLPWIVAAVVAAMLAEAMMVPTKCVPVPNVAEEPTCQKTLHACAPPASRTVVLEPVISVEPIWKMNTALGSP